MPEFLSRAKVGVMGHEDTEPAPAVLPLRGAPAMTRHEVGLWVADEKQRRHWLGVTCWCDASHPAESAGLVLVPPPWNASRRLESAWVTGGWS